MSEYEKTVNEVKSQDSRVDPKLIAKYAMMNKYRSVKERRPGKDRSKYKLGVFVGFKIGDTGMQDAAQKMRDWAEFVTNNQGLEEAIKQGLITVSEGQTVILDSRAKVFGRVNKQYGLPLDPKLRLRSRNIIMLAREASGKKLEYTRLQTNDNKLAQAWSQLPADRLVTFPARIQKHDNSGYLLSSSSDEKNKTIFKEVKEPIDFDAEFEKTLGQDVIPIEDLIAYHDATTKSWERYVVLKGVVSYIGLDNETYRGIPCSLIDPESGYEAENQVRFYMPDHIRINFGQYSTVYVLGKIKPVTEQDPADPDKKKKITVDVSVDTWGVRPIKGLATPARSSLIEEDEDVTQIEGFVPLSK